MHEEECVGLLDLAGYPSDSGWGAGANGSHNTRNLESLVVTLESLTGIFDRRGFAGPGDTILGPDLIHCWIKA